MRECGQGGVGFAEPGLRAGEVVEVGRIVGGEGKRLAKRLLGGAPVAAADEDDRPARQVGDAARGFGVVGQLPRDVRGVGRRVVRGSGRRPHPSAGDEEQGRADRRQESHAVIIAAGRLAS